MSLFDVALLDGVSDAVASELAAACVLRRFVAGEGLIGPAFRRGVVFVVVEGCVRLSRTSGSRDLTVALLDRGSVFGATEVLGDWCAELAAVTIDATTALVVGDATLRALAHRDPQLALNLLRSIGSRLRDSLDLSHALACWPVHRRIASRLCDLSARYGRPTLDCATLIDRPLTHDALAHMVGASRQTTCEVLAGLRALDVIASRRRRIAILDMAALNVIATSDEPLGGRGRPTSGPPRSASVLHLHPGSHIRRAVGLQDQP